jgi:hypothetical protein
MTLAFTSPSDNIIFQEGAMAYNYQASGTIKAGQLVYINDTMKVAACNSADMTGVVGVADYDVTDKDYIAVWGPGNIVRCKSSGSITVGAALHNSVNGHVYTDPAGVTAGCKVGVALETVATDTQVRVLLT